MTFPELLQHCGLSQKGAAMLFDVRYDTVKSWYYGRNGVPQGVMDDLNALKCAIDEIFGDIDDE